MHIHLHHTLLRLPQNTSEPEERVRIRDTAQGLTDPSLTVGSKCVSLITFRIDMSTGRCYVPLPPKKKKSRMVMALIVLETVFINVMIYSYHLQVEVPETGYDHSSTTYLL